MSPRPSLAFAIACSIALGLPTLAAAIYVPQIHGHHYIGLPIGLLIGWPMRAAVRSWRDVRVPLITAAVAGGCVLVVQLGLIMALSDPPLLIEIGIEAIAVATATATERLRAFDVGHAHAIAREDLRDLQRRTEEIEAKPRPGIIIGGARVRCASCDELVDASTTALIPSRGLLCPACRDES